MELHSQSAEDTKKLGKRFSADLKPGSIVALSGELGAGKTTFIQGVAQGLGVSSRIVSPTFIIMREYETKKGFNFYHVDLYRLEEDLSGELDNLGLNNIFKDKKDVVVIEWADKIKDLLPKGVININFENLGEDKRKILIK